MILRGIPAPHDAVAGRHHLDVESRRAFRSRASRRARSSRRCWNNIGGPRSRSARAREALNSSSNTRSPSMPKLPNASQEKSVPEDGSKVSMVSGQCTLGASTKKRTRPAPRSRLSPVLTASHALLDLVEALHELDALGRREDLDPGIDAPVVGEPARMVGLEVVEHEVVHVGEPHASLRETGSRGPRVPLPNRGRGR